MGLSGSKALFLAFAVAFQNACAARSGPPSQISSAEAAQVRTSALQAIMGSVGANAGGRVWLMPYGLGGTIVVGRDATPIRPPPLLPSPEDSVMFREAFPGIRFVEVGVERVDLFECPPGIRLRLPGRGCPIRDQGIIFSVGPLVIQGDSLTVDFVGARSYPNRPGGASSVAWSSRIIFGWVNGAWMFRRIQPLGMT